MDQPRIKICGITNPDDALLAARLGADAVGLNLFPGSRRCIAAAAVPRLAGLLPPFVEPVLLFVNEPLARALDTAQALSQVRALRTIQWHGDHPEVPPAGPWCYIPAFAIAGAACLARVAAYLDECRAAGRLPAALLLDGHAAGQYGGTGQPAPWQLLADFRPGVPVILAGGLTPDNVAEAVRLVRPYAVDVASGVESSPGVKDAEKMRRFIDNVRAAAAG
jgi:phosphoribosylanthranilate isomerase